MKSKRLFFILFLLFLMKNVSSYAQYEFIPDNTGKPLLTNKYENITGSPFFSDQWLKGEVKLANGNILKMEALKYDLVKDRLLFKAKDKEYEFFPLCVAFNLNTPNGTKTFLLKETKENSAGYYELLTDGKIPFLKKQKKFVLEPKGYNSATVEKVIEEKKSYYLLVDDIEKPVKLTKNSFLEVLSQYKSIIEDYFSKQPKKLSEQNFIEFMMLLNNQIQN